MDFLSLPTLLNIAMVDAGIPTWESKYHYQLCDDNGNTHTPMDMVMPLGARVSNTDES